MKCFKILFLILSINVAEAQQIINITDYTTNEAISFAYIKCNDIVVYSNENGLADISSLKDCNSILVYAIGYQYITVLKNEINDVIAMIPEIEQLDSVLIKSSKNQVLKTTKRIRSSKVLGSAILPSQSNILSLIKPFDEMEDKVLKKIILKTTRHAGHIKRDRVLFKNTLIKYRLEIYQNDEDSLGKLIYFSIPQSVSTGKNDELEFVIDKNIRLEDKGLYFKLVHLGALDMQGEYIITENPGLFMMRVDIADHVSKEYSITSFQHTLNGMNSSLKSMNYKDYGMGNNREFYLNYKFVYID